MPLSNFWELVNDAGVKNYP